MEVKLYKRQKGNFSVVYVKTEKEYAYIGVVRNQEEANRIKERLIEGKESLEVIKKEFRKRGTKRSTTGHRNIFWDSKHSWYIVSVKGEHIGYTRGLDEAIRMRDNYIISGEKPARRKKRNGVYVYEVKNGWVIQHRSVIDGVLKTRHVGRVETKSEAEQVRAELLNGRDYKTIKESLKNERGC